MPVTALLADDISIHALREEGDNDLLTHAYTSLTFLSTPSARRATTRIICCGKCKRYFYPRPPRGGRLHYLIAAVSFLCISIHALREEGDLPAVDVLDGLIISIHALREEGDFCPCISATLVLLFLSTPSARRATYAVDHCGADWNISIHALREEGDLFAHKIFNGNL